MLVLGIETSCDETSAAVVNDNKLLSNITTTQSIHQEYGGVVPEFASRAHMKQLSPIIKMSLAQANLKLDQIDAIAVTHGPGLAGALLVGLCTAKGLAVSLDIPFIGINHLEGHILANAVSDDLPYPFISLIASGGHTILIYVEEPFQYQICGQTIDDAAGEAFDKVAKILELGYPGGPHIEKTAREGDANQFNFPRALMNEDNLDFSFSGLKTAVLYHMHKHPDSQKADVAAAFQKAVIDVLVNKTLRAKDRFKCDNIILAGGVIHNTALREAFKKAGAEHHFNLILPEKKFCTDNAAMIARAGHMRLTQGFQSSLDLDVSPNLSLNNNV
ncbi:MAG: tRNA (adenosine(37)-N6)-threonylcarbamoyltransferase complex transferase subunit TsaD [candidate division KSB1 bacterium]|nr:tRNA (adenosine(37)-N6)-threonylcarbamoyltransferase complex transferase subunit TsaD [candidate division KSB1 bacterium]